jgi:xanthine dehydrogenase large subunit
MMESKYRTVGANSPHESAHLHVSGRAQYTDDIPEWQGTLYGAFGLSERAHARITKLDLSKVRSSPGVVAVITANDIPGDKYIGAAKADDAVLPGRLLRATCVCGGRNFI